jgi:hypothetical protein
MDQVAPRETSRLKLPDFREAWNVVTGHLQSEMPRAQFETWVQPLRPLGYRDRVFRVSAANTFTVDWVESRLKNRISSLLTGVLNEPVTFKVVVSNSYHKPDPEKDLPQLQENSPEDEAQIPSGNDREIRLEETEPEPSEKGKASPRKLMLHRAYGSERARLIQPERGMFVTMYFFQHWLPLIGHSAFAVILAARSMCYWNPKTGELRDSIETDMADLASRASVSVRTVKDVLNQELVKHYFIRYSVRRLMTPNGIRTAGIFLQVRMDDPLTPEDQETSGIAENEHWYLPEFDDESED